MLQEGLIALYSAVESFDPAKGAKFRTYACVCIKNRLLSFIKTEPGASDTLEEDTVPSPENIFIEKETEKTLFESLRRVLSEREFAVLSLRIDGYSYADIALTLNLTQKSIDNTMSRIRGKLRK
jgi:RNA polymerase sporulation-specific sigma factor